MAVRSSASHADITRFPARKVSVPHVRGSRDVQFEHKKPPLGNRKLFLEAKERSWPSEGAWGCADEGHAVVRS
jgi:hypothetical protein